MAWGAKVQERRGWKECDGGSFIATLHRSDFVPPLALKTCGLQKFCLTLTHKRDIAMKRIVFNIVAILFCISAFAQAVDMQVVMSEYQYIKPQFTVKALENSLLTSDIRICKSSLPIIIPRFMVKPFESSPLFSDAVILKLSVPFTPYLQQNRIIISEAEPSVVVNTSYKNLTAPAFSQPNIQTLNGWQVLLKAGIGLTRGLAFGDYNSDSTLDD